MIQYYCDGSESEAGVGCGIIRVEKKKIIASSKTDHMLEWKSNCEGYSIYQTLLLIKERKDRRVIIYNDNHALVDAINLRKKQKYRKKFNKTIDWEAKTSKILFEMDKLKEKGFQIMVEKTPSNEDEYLKLAHTNSRLYMKKI